MGRVGVCADAPICMGSRGRGHTLSELLIALALGLIVTAGAVSLYQSQRQAFWQSSDFLQMQDAGMSALTLIAQQIQIAGFTPAAATQVQRSFAVFGCSGARPVGSAGSVICEPLPGASDGIVLRYFDDGMATWPTAAGLPTDCLGQGVGQAGSSGAEIINRYYARTSSSTGQPELYCEGNGRPGLAQPLVEGVERLHLRYWPAGAARALEASAFAPGQWQQITAVDLCVLVRGAPRQQGTTYIDCDGARVTSADTRMRRAFWRHVAVRNGHDGRDAHDARDARDALKETR
nr:PilW family protein [Paraburkholderia hayleyella]